MLKYITILILILPLMVNAQQGELKVRVYYQGKGHLDSTEVVIKEIESKDSTILIYNSALGAYIGTTNLKFFTLTIRYPGYKTFSKDYQMRFDKEKTIRIQLSKPTDSSYYSTLGGYNKPYFYYPKLLLVMLSPEGIKNRDKVENLLKKHHFIADSENRIIKNISPHPDSLTIKEYNDKYLSNYPKLILVEIPKNIENYQRKIKKVLSSPYISDIGHLQRLHAGAMFAFNNKAEIIVSDSMSANELKQLMDDYNLTLISSSYNKYYKGDRKLVSLNCFGHQQCEIVKRLSTDNRIQFIDHNIFGYNPRSWKK